MKIDIERQEGAVGVSVDFDGTGEEMLNEALAVISGVMDFVKSASTSLYAILLDQINDMADTATKEFVEDTLKSVAPDLLSILKKYGEDSDVASNLN